MGSVPTDGSVLSNGYDGKTHLGGSMADTSSTYVDGMPVRQATSRPQSAYGNYDDHDHGSTVQQLEGAGLNRTASGASRSNTLKKKGSVSRKGSLKRSGSRRSMHAGSIKGVNHGGAHRDGAEMHSVFYTPIPTSGSPTEILANRFQTWRKLLKDLITYFREVQTSYEHRAKALLKVSNIIGNITMPAGFLAEGGLHDANNFLQGYHRQAIAESNKAKDIQNDVINHLNGLRQDLAAKIKEIKSLSGDFKNSVDKEKDGTRKVVQQLEEALQVADHDPAAMVGKDDPFIVRLAVDRQVERQIDEENYLHRAYLNLEGSGRELESIVVGEIQKAYNALAGILKREADDAYDTVEKLRSGPIGLPKDVEWTHFVENDPHFINPEIPLRKVEDIDYPGKHAPAAAEVRAGMLERKSKYLKSYTPGWYVLSPTHLHEFKSADRIYTQPPVMSLFLADQKLGSKSSPDSSSHKFMLKGKQTGSMHRGHSWVFRAESYETMLSWYDAIKLLTEGSLPERNAFVKKHARSMSAGSVSGESVMDEDEADQVPFSTVASRDMAAEPVQEELKRPQRPSPGGRFPSDLNANQYLRTPGATRPLSPSSGSSVDERDFSAPPAGGTYTSHEPPIQPTPVLLSNQQGFQQRHQAQPLSDGASPTAAPLQQQQPQPQPQQHTPPLAEKLATAGQAQQPPPAAHREAEPGAWLGGAAIGAGAGVAAEEYWRRKHLADAEAQQVAMPPPSTAVQPLPVDKVTDAEKVAAATAMPPDITTTEGLVSPVSPVSSTGGLPGGVIVAGGATHLASVTSIEDGGLAPGKELVVEKPVIDEPAPVVAPVAAPAAAAPLEDQTPVSNGAVSKPVEPSATTTTTTTDEGVAHTAYDTSPRDGSVNAHPTGAIFPRILRHNTDVTVSDLHVPGEWKA